MFKDVSDFYQPLKLLGKGGSSKVYLVVDKEDHIEYASKCVEKRYLKEDGGFVIYCILLSKHYLMKSN
jgi:serine/threonine protein kinase